MVKGRYTLFYPFASSFKKQIWFELPRERGGLPCPFPFIKPLGLETYPLEWIYFSPKQKGVSYWGDSDRITPVLCQSCLTRLGLWKSTYCAIKMTPEEFLPIQTKSSGESDRKMHSWSRALQKKSHYVASEPTKPISNVYFPLCHENTLPSQVCHLINKFIIS